MFNLTPEETTSANAPQVPTDSSNAVQDQIPVDPSSSGQPSADPAQAVIPSPQMSQQPMQGPVPVQAQPGQPQQTAPQPGQTPVQVVAANPKATLFHSLLNVLGGGDQQTYSVDPATGKLTAQNVPQTKGQLAKHILAGALVGLLSPKSPDANRGPGSVIAGVQQGFQAVQNQRQQQTEQAKTQAVEDYNRGENAKVRQAQTLETNLRMLHNAILVGRMNKEDHDSMIQQYVPQLNELRAANALTAENVTEQELKSGKYPASQYGFIPMGTVPRIGTDGKQATDSNGVPQWDNSYAVYDAATQLPLAKSVDLPKAQKWGLLPRALDITRIPDTSSASSNYVAILNHKIQTREQVQNEINDMTDALNKGKTSGDADYVQPIDLASLAKANPGYQKAIDRFATTAGVGTDPNQQLDALSKVDPNAAGLMRAAFGPNNLENYKDTLIQNAAQAKSAGAVAGKMAGGPTTIAEANAIKANPKATPEQKAVAQALIDQTTNQEANLAGKKKTAEENATMGGTGNSTLTGDAYIKTLPAPRQSLVSSIGTGRIVPDKLAYLLAKNPTLVQDVVQAYPDFDYSRALTYPATFKDYTSGKTSVALNKGATALKHLRDLKAINDANPVEVRIDGTAANQTYNNLLDTVTGELSSFYQLPSTDQSIKSMRDTLGSFTNRDAAIVRQAKSMGEKFDSFEKTWKNAAPSAAYEKPMPGIDDKAKAARAALDPEYAQAQAQASSAAQTPAPNQTQTPPQAKPAPKPGQVSVQIPGQPWGYIPSNNVAAFKAKHPDAIIGQ